MNKHTLIKYTLTLSLCALALFPVCTPAQAASEVVVYSFQGPPTDGDFPLSGLSGDSAHNGYGITYKGGTYNLGTVFKITSSGVETVLHSFSGGSGDGQYPGAGLTLGKDGNFYGTTSGGGAYPSASGGNGTVYKITPSGVETVLHSFGAVGDGSAPLAGLTLGKDGNFYGTTYQGGTYGYGTVYKITPSGVETVLHSFGAAGDGYAPEAGLTLGKDGNFYGTTARGGASDYGTVFEITPTGQETVLHSFGAVGDGSAPLAGLTLGKDGNFYGTTDTGGASGYGTVFEITPTGQETVLHSFNYATLDGAFPEAALLLAKDGNFYGTTNLGGAYYYGTVFEITPSGVETVLHSFNYATLDGSQPVAPLVQDKNGYLYGTTEGGGLYGDGTIFSIKL